MPIVQPGSSDAPEIEDGLYRAKIKAVKERTLEKPDKFGNTEKFEIEITFKDNEGEDQTLNPLVNRKWGEKAALFLIATACGIDAEPYEPFDTDIMVGREVNVLVETEEVGQWPRIKSWARVKQKSGSASPQRVTGAATQDCQHVDRAYRPDGKTLVCLTCKAEWQDDGKIDPDDLPFN